MNSQLVLLSEIFPPKHGGSGRWFYEVYRRLGVRNTVLTDSPSESREQAGNTTVIRFPFQLQDTGGMSPTGFFGYARLLWRVRRRLLGEDVRALQVARVVPEGWIAFLWSYLGGPEYQCFAHGEEVNLEGAAHGGVMSSRQHQWMAKRVFKKAKLVIANSQNTAMMLKNQWGLPNEKVRVVYPGVDTEFFNANGSAMNTGHPTLLTVGRLQERKGHDAVLRSLPRILTKFPTLQYVVVGDGPEAGRLKSLARELRVENSVAWVPAATDTELRDLYQSCDLFILANRQVGSDVEGFGMVLLEAAACGKATISGRSGGTKEAIVDGQTGRLIDASQPGNIRVAVIEMLSNPDQLAAMGNTGRKRVEDQFDWSKVAAELSAALLA